MRNTSVSLAQLQGWLAEGLQRLLAAADVVGRDAVVMGALGTAVSFIMMLFVLFFVLRDGPALAQQVVRMLPIEGRRRTLLWQHLMDVTRAVFLGIGLTPWPRACCSASGFWIAGLPSPLVFGVLGVILALDPDGRAGVAVDPGARSCSPRRASTATRSSWRSGVRSSSASWTICCVRC